MYSLSETMRRYIQAEIAGYLVGLGGICFITFVVSPRFPDIRVHTWGNAMLIVILIVALTWGMRAAIVTSGLASLYVLNFHFQAQAKDAAISFGVFGFTSVMVSQLSAHVRRRIRENLKLNEELRAASERTSQLEAVKRSEQLKSALLDSVTHDLRTPLTSIKAASSAMIDIRRNNSATTAFSRASEDSLLNIIVQQSNRLDRFINGMIELATVETNEKNQVEECASVEDAVDTALARASDALNEHNIVVECPEDLKVTASSGAISQAIFCLLENAGKYAPPGTTIRIEAERHKANQILLAVEDEGPGVPITLRSKVFDKFFRGNLGGQPGSDGLGLGLAIARGIIEGEGGRIWIEDGKQGKGGARFVFTIPCSRQLQMNPEILSK